MSTIEHQFWSKQPIVLQDQDEILEGYIDPEIPVTSPPDQPATLPGSFSWSTIDIHDDSQLDELYEFLKLHYIEDDQHCFRFCLSKDLLRWALGSPSAIPEWIFGVRASNGRICGFISGTPEQIRLRDSVDPWCSVNFLCVHTKLRTKRLAQLLIFELARRVRVSKVYRAVFSGDEMPSKPFFTTAYQHRVLNLQKLIRYNFYPQPEPKKLPVLKKKFAIPNLVHRVRPMVEGDVEAVCNLLQEYTKQFTFSIQFTPEKVRHMFLPRDKLLYSYVIPNDSGIQGFFSFYIMDWLVLRERDTTIKSAYLYYFATNGVQLETMFTDFVNLAAEAGADLITALYEMGAGGALTANHFEKGNKALEFYSYNYAVQPLSDADACFFFI